MRVANALFPLIATGGGIVAIASSSVWAGPQPWKAVVRETMSVWFGADVVRRAVAGRMPDAPPHQDVLRETPFGEPRIFTVVQRHAWTTATLVGLLSSSSLQLRDVRGTRTGAFQRDLRERLAGLAPNDRFEEDIEFTIVSVTKI